MNQHLNIYTIDLVLMFHFTYVVLIFYLYNINTYFGKLLDGLSILSNQKVTEYYLMATEKICLLNIIFS